MNIQKAMIFDVYGVLMPSVFWILADDFMPQRTVEQEQAMHDMLRATDAGYLSKDQHLKATAELLNTDVTSVIAARSKLDGVDEQLLKLIEECRQEYGCKSGVISNAGKGFLEEVMPRERWERYFDSFIISSEVGVQKPAPRIFEIALERLNVEPESCIYFDDRERNVAVAKSLGMQSYLYTGRVKCSLQIREFLQRD